MSCSEERAALFGTAREHRIRAAIRDTLPITYGTVRVDGTADYASDHGGYYLRAECETCHKVRVMSTTGTRTADVERSAAYLASHVTRYDCEHET